MALEISEPVPNSTGTARPRHAAPPGACDCHIHAYDSARFPPSRPGSRMVGDAGVAEYRRLQARIGTSRTVVVQPAAYGTDNAVTLDAVARLGIDARGVAVVTPDIDDATLQRFDRGGIRGIRFTQFDPATAVTTPDMIEPLAARIQPLGWHTQIHLRSDQIVAAAAMLERLPGQVVYDHMGRLRDAADPAFAVLRRLLGNGRTWIKLSGAYFAGPPPYAQAAPVARALISAAPERMVWGSDWPHPTEREKPDDAALFDLLAEWAPDETTRRRILVDNPAMLYGFER